MPSTFGRASGTFYFIGQTAIWAFNLTVEKSYESPGDALVVIVYRKL
ncbi:hypothetical protein [Cohnella nanjingensis]|nr:hypothetical protein [Cohnella nanjingensis]